MSIRRAREVIERLPGGFLIDVEYGRSIETAEVVARLIRRIWPEVALHIATQTVEEFQTVAEQQIKDRQE